MIAAGTVCAFAVNSHGQFNKNAYEQISDSNDIEDVNSVYDDSTNEPYSPIIEDKISTINLEKNKQNTNFNENKNAEAAEAAKESEGKTDQPSSEEIAELSSYYQPQQFSGTMY